MKKRIQPETESQEPQGFLNFLFSSEEEDLNEIRADLHSYGIDVQKVEALSLGFLERAQKLSWLERARVKQARFEERVKVRVEEVSRKFKTSKELLDAMLSGELGTGMQARAGVFFRNRDAAKVSEKDLRSFIEDNLLLDETDEDSLVKK